MIIKKSYLYGLLLGLLFLAACKTVEVKAPPYAEGIENIRHNLEKEKIDLFQAYVQLNRLTADMSNDAEAREKAELFRESVVEMMDEKALVLFNEESYDDSIRYLTSLYKIGVKESSVDLRDCYNKLLASLGEDNLFTANGLKEEMAELKLLTEVELFDYLKYFYDEKSSGLFVYSLERYGKLYPGLLKSYPQLLKMKEELAKIEELDFEQMMESVVTVILDRGMTSERGVSYPDKGIGTGFFIDEEGHILTNHHVIASHVDPAYEGYSAVYVTLRSDPDTEIPAEVIGYDKVLDLALLKVPGDNRSHLTTGRSRDIKVGSKVYTIGNPLGISYTVTSGIVSNKELDFFQLGQTFMVDAAINPGNSGGPLFDEKGQVIGIVFAGIPEYEGINFAIPFSWVKKSLPHLFKGGEVERAWIGAGLYEYRGTLMFHYIMNSGSAANAGLLEGDILKRIDGKEVKTIAQAQEALSWKRFPALVELEIERNRESKKFLLRLDRRPPIPVAAAFRHDTQAKLITLVLGVELDYYAKQLNNKKYMIKKVYLGMPGAKFNLGEGDPIVVYDMRYEEKEKAIYLAFKYKKKELGVTDRGLAVRIPAEINNIL